MDSGLEEFDDDFSSTGTLSMLFKKSDKLAHVNTLEGDEEVLDINSDQLESEITDSQFEGQNIKKEEEQESEFEANGMESEVDNSSSEYKPEEGEMEESSDDISLEDEGLKKSSEEEKFEKLGLFEDDEEEEDEETIYDSVQNQMDGVSSLKSMSQNLNNHLVKPRFQDENIEILKAQKSLAASINSELQCLFNLQELKMEGADEIDITPIKPSELISKRRSCITRSSVHPNIELTTSNKNSQFGDRRSQLNRSTDDTFGMEHLISEIGLTRLGNMSSKNSLLEKEEEPSVSSAIRKSSDIPKTPATPMPSTLNKNIKEFSTNRVSCTQYQDGEEGLTSSKKENFEGQDLDSSVQLKTHNQASRTKMVNPHQQDDLLVEQGASYFTTPGKLFSSIVEGGKKLIFGGGSENQNPQKQQLLATQKPPTNTTSSLSQKDLNFQKHAIKRISEVTNNPIYKNLETQGSFEDGQVKVQVIRHTKTINEMNRDGSLRSSVVLDLSNLQESIGTRSQVHSHHQGKEFDVTSQDMSTINN